VRTLPLNKLPASFNVSGTDATKDKLGRPIAEHIQVAGRGLGLALV